MKPVEVGQYLEVDPRVCHGKLVFKGTRVPVHTVLVYLAKGETMEEILTDWPEVTREAVGEAVGLAAAALVEKYQAPKKAAHEPAHPGRSA